MYIKIQQQHRRPVYTFRAAWFRPGGPLHGRHFIDDIVNSRPVDTAFVTSVDNVHTVAGDESLPDVLFYLYELGSGNELWWQLVPADSVLFLYGWYSAHGFDAMLDGLGKNTGACLVV